MYFSAKNGEREVCGLTGASLRDGKMKLRMRFVVRCIAGALIALSLSVAERGSCEAGGAGGTDEALRRLKKSVVSFTLPNGIRVLFVKRSFAPVFAGQVMVKVGGVDEVPGSTGIAHFFEHMAFKGSERIGTKDFAAEKPLLDRLEQIVSGARDQKAALESAEVQDLEKRLSALWVDNEFGRIYNEAGGVSANAATSKDWTNYVVELPNNALPLWGFMESERLFHPVLRQFYKEREVVQEERRRGYDDNPSGRLYELLLQTAYLLHPDRLPVIGYPVDLQSLTATQMRAFYAKYYRPDNMVIGIVGDLEADDVRRVTEMYFGRYQNPDTPLPKVREVEPPQEGERDAELIADAEPELLIGYHKPVHPDPDDSRFAVLHSLLSEVRSSIFEKELVRAKKLAASISTTEAPGQRFPSLFVVSAAPQPGVSNRRLADEVQKIFDRMAKIPVSAAELEAAKRRVRVGVLKSLETDMGLAESLADSELLYGDWGMVFEMLQIVERTSAADIQNLASRYLRRDQRTFVHLEKKGAAVR